MRKRYAAVMAALLVGLAACPLGAAAAGPADTDIRETAENAERSADGNLPEEGTDKESADDGETKEALSGETPESEKAGKISLQIPQKLQATIDPFELDGRGQIYSEPYTIWNTGETAGILTLSFTGRSESAEIRPGKDGIHDGESKALYMEFIIGETDTLILSPEGSEYQAELKPGEGLSLRFSGEVNENASDSWKDGDIAVEGIYQWEVSEEISPEETSAEEEKSTGEGAAEEAETDSGKEIVPTQKKPDPEEAGDSETPEAGEEPGALEETLGTETHPAENEAPNGEIFATSETSEEETHPGKASEEEGKRPAEEAVPE